MEEHGFIINMVKSHLQPSQVLLHLGVRFKLKEATVSLPKERRGKNFLGYQALFTQSKSPTNALSTHSGTDDCLPGLQVQDTILAARRPSTTRIHQVTWSTFCSWMRKSGVDPLQAGVPAVLGFLQAGVKKGLCPSKLRRQTSALASVLIISTKESHSLHPDIQRFLKGAVNLGPPPIHRFPSWDLNKVLNALTKTPFKPMWKVPLRLMSFKVLFLVAVTSARRVSELAALSVRDELCIFQKESVAMKLDPTFLPKVNTVFHRSQELVLPYFCPNPRHPKEHA
ncbi:uncharacterized protein LOC128334322 [Hemicordylus capensis]|uniref:uncharacterized protein LOC128334322 n=1 Tax=Hemicordylus capensis TaxID=884348 RepID=UPI002303031B|nr:uncharacterized protein LOC128334322 [Hemicordylus capensis]